MFPAGYLLSLLISTSIAAELPKVQELRDLVEASYSDTGLPIASLNTTGYKNLVLKSPKPYHLIILLTASEQVCRVCPPFERIFEHSALSYYKEGRMDEDVPVFFAKVDVMKNSALTDLHGLRQLPLISAVGQSRSLSKKKSGRVSYKPRDLFPIKKPDHSAQELLDWVNQQAGREVKLYYTPSERFVRALVVLGALGGVGLAALLVVMACRKSNWVVTAIALAVQYISTSGLFYNILQGMVWMGADDKGNPQFIMPGSRGQFLAEGLTMSGLSLLSALSLLFSSRLPYTSLGKTLGSDGVGVGQMCCLLLSGICMWLVFSAYKVKSGWYQDPSFFPPEWYKTGPYNRDQGNSF